MLSGGARGVDTLAVAWAEANGVPYKVFPARWQRTDPLTGQTQTYRYAGPNRNNVLAYFGDQLIAVRSRRSHRGTDSMIEIARKCGLPVFVYDLTEAEEQVEQP